MKMRDLDGRERLLGTRQPIKPTGKDAPNENGAPEKTKMTHPQFFKLCEWVTQDRARKDWAPSSMSYRAIAELAASDLGFKVRDANVKQAIECKDVDYTPPQAKRGGARDARDAWITERMAELETRVERLEELATAAKP